MREMRRLASIVIVAGLNVTLGLACPADSTDDDATGDEDVTVTPSPTPGPPALEEAWRASGLTWPESARYDADHDIIYVSHTLNGGGVATLDPEGNVIETEWATGLSGARGVDITNGRVYVATDLGLAEIDASNGTVLQTYSVPDMGMPNDVAVDASGNVYVSDLVTHAIYRLSQGTFDVWLKDTALEGPNGLVVETNRIVVASYGVITNYETFAADPAYVRSVSLSDKVIAKLTAAPVGNLDGLSADSRGNYFMTDWQAGTILYLTKTGEVSELLQLAVGNADLMYVPELDMLLVPSSLAGEVVAFDVK